MPLAQWFEKGPCQIGGIWAIEEDLPELIRQAGLFPEELRVIDKFGSLARQKEYVAVRVLCRLAIHSFSDFFEDCPEPFPIGYHPSGKPFLKCSTMELGISHTAGFACVLFSKMPMVGVDIEHISHRVVKVSKKFVSSSERSLQGAMPDETFHTLVWSVKEVVVKATGKRDLDFLNQIEVSLINRDSMPFRVEAVIRTDGFTSIFRMKWVLWNGTLVCWTH